MIRLAMRVLAWLAVLSSAAAVEARSLDQAIPGLFGGTLATFIDPRAGRDAQRPRLADQFKRLSAALSAARSQAPIPSASGSFSYGWDEDADTYTRLGMSLGSMVAERAPTLGRGVGTIGVSYTRIDFDTFEGHPLHNLTASQPSLSASLLSQLPASDRARAEDDVLETRLDLALSLDLLFLTASYGVTDQLDVSIALSVNHAHLSARGSASIRDPDGDGGSYFVVDQPGVVVGGTGECQTDFHCANDSFHGDETGTGDVFLRAKWLFRRGAPVDVALAGTLTVPTGNADELLGFHDVTFTPLFILSRSFGRFSAHTNVGYAIRSQRDISQALWIGGADVAVTSWLTLAIDFLGFHDHDRDGINDNVYQCAPGLKASWRDRLVTGFGVQLPLNRDGLRADVIYTGQLEASF